MPDSTERFIAAATGPFADNPELQIAASNKLAESITVAGKVEADSLEDATSRLAKAGPGKGLKQWRTALFAFAALVSVSAIAISFRSLGLYRQAVTTITGTNTFGPGSAPSYADIAGHLTEKERFLLLGDTTKRFRSEQKEAVWASDPENPAFFVDYATPLFSERRNPPANFLTVGRQIDPKNAWFSAVSAGISAKEGMVTGGTLHGTPGGVKIHAVRDQAKLDESMALFHEAAQLPRLENYSEELMKMWIPLLPPRTDVVSQFPGVIYLAGLPAISLQFRYLSDAVNIKAHQLAQAKDVEGFQSLMADWEKFSTVLASSPSVCLVDMLVNSVVLRGPLKGMAEAAADLGLQEDAKRLSDLDARFDHWASEKKSRLDPNKDVALRSSFLAGLSLPSLSQTTRDPVPISSEDLKPGRMADHALADRLLSLVAWVGLCFASLAAFLYRFRTSILTRRLAARMELLLRPLDWAWIIGAGSLLPLLYYLVIHGHSPLGGKEWSLKASNFIVPAGQASAMLSLMIVLPILIARRRLGFRAGMIGLASGKSAWGWASVGFGAIALPLFGAAFFFSGRAEVIFSIVAGLLAALQLYCLIVGLRALFGGQATLLRRVTLSRILLPAYVAGALLMALLVPLHHAEEKQWISKETLMGYSIDAPSLSRYEYEVTRQLQRELLEILGTKP